VTKFSELIFS